MYLFRESGPYCCILICGMVLDTNGGPRTNPTSQVLRPDGSAISGLYGAGNCVASVACGGCLSVGSSWQLAATFACLAAEHVTRESACDLSTVCARASALISSENGTR